MAKKPSAQRLSTDARKALALQEEMKFLQQMVESQKFFLEHQAKLLLQRLHPATLRTPGSATLSGGGL